jgi:hypothetical protein
MVAVTHAFSITASTACAAKLQAKPCQASARFGMSRTSAVSLNRLQKAAPAIVASRKTVRCDQSWVKDCLTDLIDNAPANTHALSNLPNV